MEGGDGRQVGRMRRSGSGCTREDGEEEGLGGKEGRGSHLSAHQSAHQSGQCLGSFSGEARAC